jgi:hypothetical protein
MLIAERRRQLNRIGLRASHFQMMCEYKSLHLRCFLFDVPLSHGDFAVWHDARKFNEFGAMEAAS